MSHPKRSASRLRFSNFLDFSKKKKNLLWCICAYAFPRRGAGGTPSEKCWQESEEREVAVVQSWQHVYLTTQFRWDALFALLELTSSRSLARHTCSKCVFCFLEIFQNVLFKIVTGIVSVVRKQVRWTETNCFLPPVLTVRISSDIINLGTSHWNYFKHRIIDSSRVTRTTHNISPNPSLDQFFLIPESQRSLDWIFGAQLFEPRRATDVLHRHRRLNR